MCAKGILREGGGIKVRDVVLIIFMIFYDVFSCTLRSRNLLPKRKLFAVKAMMNVDTA